MSNFTFLNNDWPDLYATAREAEQNVNSAPRTSCFYARRSLERTVKWLYANDSYLKQPYADNSGDYLTWERICCENGSSVHIPVNSRQLTHYFQLLHFLHELAGVSHDTPIPQ